MEWKEKIDDIKGGRIEKAKVEAQRKIAEELFFLNKNIEEVIRHLDYK